MSADPCDPSGNRPIPPPEIQGPALAEWTRVCDELDAAGRLDRADRAVLIVYVQTWAVYQWATERVTAFGPVINHHNGVAGPSPFYKVSRETALQLQKLLADLGLTPAARHRMKAAAEEAPDALEF